MFDAVKNSISGLFLLYFYKKAILCIQHCSSPAPVLVLAQLLAAERGYQRRHGFHNQMNDE
jgi:hypothetical protein